MCYASILFCLAMCISNGLVFLFVLYVLCLIQVCFTISRSRAKEMFDAHPKNIGMNFTLTPNGRDVLLIEAQESLGQNNITLWAG